MRSPNSSVHKKKFVQSNFGSDVIQVEKTFSVTNKENQSKMIIGTIFI